MKEHSFCGVKCFTNNPCIMFLFQLDTVLFFITSTVELHVGADIARGKYFTNRPADTKCTSFSHFAVAFVIIIEHVR